MHGEQNRISDSLSRWHLSQSYADIFKEATVNCNLTETIVSNFEIAEYWKLSEQQQESEHMDVRSGLQNLEHAIQMDNQTKAKTGIALEPNTAENFELPVVSPRRSRSEGTSRQLLVPPPPPTHSFNRN